MEVISYTVPAQEDADGVHFVSLEELLRRSDYVTLHCPLLPSTHHIINKGSPRSDEALRLLDQQLPEGPLVDEAALIEALQNKGYRGAALDVKRRNPGRGQPFTPWRNVILTPHGLEGLETRQRLLSLLKKNIDAYLAGNPSIL